MGHFYPGEDQEAHVVGQKVNVGFPITLVPPDKLITGRTFPGCGSEEYTRQGVPIFIKGHVLHVLTHGATKAKVMVAVNQAFKKIQASIVYLLNSYRSNRLKGTGNRSGFMWNYRN
jgi:hypothetical protein